MATEHRYTAKELVERDFECTRCGARALVELPVIGKSAWVREGFFSGEAEAVATASQQAAHALVDDARKALALVKCPCCHRRAARVPKVIAGRVIASGGMFAVLGLLFDGLVTAGVLGGAMAIAALMVDIGRIRRTDKMSVRNYVRGTPPAPEIAALPRARALAAPPSRPAIAPLASVPPPRHAQTKGDRPTLLLDPPSEP